MTRVPPANFEKLDYIMNNNDWNSLTKEQIEKFLQTHTIKGIRQELDISRHQIYKKMRQVGIEYGGHKRLQHRYRFLEKYSKEQLQNLYNEYKSNIKLAKYLKIPSPVLYELFTRLGIEEIQGLAVRGQVLWNKGLTKETDPKINAIATKLTQIKRSEEYKQNMSKIMKKSESHKADAKIVAQKLRGRILPRERVERMIKAVTGKPHKMTPEGSQKIRETSIKTLLRRYKNKFLQPTNIEILLEAELKRRNIPFESQISILQRAITDVFIEPCICIFADGDYFHSSPKMVEHDKFITQYLERGGFKVFRFWGSEIKKDVKFCVDKVQTFLNTLKSIPQE